MSEHARAELDALVEGIRLARVEVENRRHALSLANNGVSAHGSRALGTYQSFSSIKEAIVECANSGDRWALLGLARAHGRADASARAVLADARTLEAEAIGKLRESEQTLRSWEQQLEYFILNSDFGERER